jgi:NADPH:quinone reductase-like Zn-dependent oxidoreductase
MDEPLKGPRLQTLLTAEGELRLSFKDVTLDAPAPDEVILRIEAAPLNPSDLGQLFGPADMATLRTEQTEDGSALVATVHQRHLPLVAKRIGLPIEPGNEGAGTVVRAGADVVHLLGKKVAAVGGAMYGRYRKLPGSDCVVLPEDASVADGAAMFINPLTALGFVETMRLDGHGAIVHTAAASNLGQMLVKICRADGIPLINIVRSPQQVALLREIGATHIIDSSAPDFEAALTDAITETGATIGFDAIGGGEMASMILNAMEVAIQRKTDEYSRYGSDIAKRVYIYGMLDPGPTTVKRQFGFGWDIGGWLLWPALRRIGEEGAQRMRQRVLDELKTTFASHYTRRIALTDLLKPDIIEAAQRKSTGEKFLIVHSPDGES